jgi:PAS domain S-box-containing protein
MSFWTRPSGIALIYAAFALAWILGSGALLALAVPDPVIAARIEVLKGAAFVVVTSLLLFLLLRGRDVATRAGPLPVAAAGPRTVLLLAVVALGAPLVASGVHALNRGQMERGRLDDLHAIAGLKAGQLAGWLQERRSDAATLAESLGFIERVTTLLETGDDRERERVRDRLAAMQRQYLYETVSLLDARGHSVLALGVASEMEFHGAGLLPIAFATGEVQDSGLYQDRAGRIRLDFIAPLLAWRNGAHEPVGAVVLGEDADSSLFPLVIGWPGASRSGEAFLVRRDGDAPAYLSPLRHHDGEALTLRGNPDTASLPAAAIREGSAGTVIGVDYRGVEVLAAFAPVPGTDWFVIAKEDRAEALAPARQLALWVGLMTLIALAVVAAVMLALLRTRQRAEHLALQAQADRQRRLFFELPFIGMAITDPQTGRWVQFNDRLCEMFGYSREELAARTWAEMTHPEDLGKDMAEFERVLRVQAEGYVLDKRFIRRDGVIVDTTIDVKCVRNDGGDVEHLVCLVQDVTERRLAEERVINAARLYATLSRCSHAIVHSAGEEELFAQVCRAAVESAGMKLVWVGMADAGGHVQPVARFGPGAEHLDGVRISVAGDDPHGRGPTGVAIREGRAYWCQDFLADPGTAPWHELGARYGWGACAALPLLRGGASVGALTLYAARPLYFDEQTRTLLMDLAQDISFALEKFDRDRSRRCAEETARALTEQLSLHLEASPAVSYALTLDGASQRPIWVSGNVMRMTGYSVAEALEPDWWERNLHPEDAGACREAFRAALAGEPEPWHEFRFRHRDGHYIRVLDSFRVVRDAGGQPVQVAGAWLDVSSRR